MVLADDPLHVSIKCEPELEETWRSTYESIVPGYHLNKRHWITATLNRDVEDQRVRELIEDSYDLVKPKRPRSSRTSTGSASAAPGKAPRR